MSSVLKELKDDIKELEQLLETATRSKVKILLSNELQKLQTEYIKKEKSVKHENSAATVLEGDADTITAKPTVSTVPRGGYAKEITTYGWDQSDKFMKIYVTLNGVQNIEKKAVTSQFKQRSFRLDVTALDNCNPYVAVSLLYDEIIPEESYHKIKTDMVLLMLKKKTEKKTWAYVTEREKKQKEKSKPKIDENADPNDSLMNMMKQMYDDGDEEMKRTIAKAWTESREKTAGAPM